MREFLSRNIRSAWPVIAAAGASLLLLGAAVAATGGADWAIGGVRVRVHEPWRLLGAGSLLIAAAAWLGGRQFGSALAQAWDTRDRYAAWIAAVAAGTAALVGLVRGTWAAGSADSYGYVSQAMLWLKGLPIQPEPLAAVVPWPQAEWSLAPLGYRPAVVPGAIVPTYAPGLPLTMAAAVAIGGPSAAFVVVPVLGAAAVWLTFLLGRRYADAASGAGAAVLLAASPVFLYQVVQPMSDVPVTAWWLLALWGAAANRPPAAGVGAALALLTRPNLAPAAIVVVAAVMVHAHVRTPGPRGVLRAAALCAAPLALAAAFLAWLNATLYGSPVASGYGSASELFSAANVLPNAVRYTRWLLDTHTPFILIGLAAPVAGRLRTRSASAPPALAWSWLGLAFVAAVFACYLPYATFDDWWYLRFLLPAIAVLLLLATPVCVRIASLLPAGSRASAAIAGAGVLATLYVSSAVHRDAFELRRLESRYITAGEFAAARLPANAVLLSVQESGPLRLYGQRTTVRFDYIDPKGLDAAVQFLDRTGRRPFFALEAWEETQFRDRFSRHSVLGLLDWPPAAEVGRPVKVRFYDPRDRARFLDGEPVRTAHDSIEQRDTR